MADPFDLMQWPAMVITLAAAWLVASKRRGRRKAGFWLFLVSNVMWVAWAFHISAVALVLLQVGLAAMNIRGALENESAAD